GANLYAYANGNPLAGIDPLGLDAHILMRGYRGTAFDPNVGHVSIAVDLPGGGVLVRDAAKPSGNQRHGELRSSTVYKNLDAARAAEGDLGMVTLPDKILKHGVFGAPTSDDIVREAIDTGYMGPQGTARLYCSTYVARVLEAAGYDLGSGLTPNMLFKSAQKKAKKYNLTVEYSGDDCPK
ncbi:MAG: hypothetical protein QME66_13900, partial [Candidatus Eisenbacteria bacterium]|nr:hypothetical protein [Candidatus Eisenbacteria bacterium]